MSEFRIWAMSVCTAAVVCGILRQVLPENALGKTVRLLIPCLFLLALLAPLPSLRLSSFRPVNEETAVNSQLLESRMKQQIAEQTNIVYRAAVNEAWAAQGWQAEKVTVDVDIDDNGGISIGQIVIYVSGETAENRATAKRLAQTYLEQPVTVLELEEQQS